MGSASLLIFHHPPPLTSQQEKNGNWGGGVSGGGMRLRVVRMAWGAFLAPRVLSRREKRSGCIAAGNSDFTQREPAREDKQDGF